MLRIIHQLAEAKAEIQRICARTHDNQVVHKEATVREVLQTVKRLGDQAVLHYTAEFDQQTLSREQMRLSAQNTAQALQLQAGQEALVCIPTQYIGGAMMLVRCLEIGLNATIIAPTANPLAKLHKAYHLVAMVPMQLQQALAQSPEKRGLLEQFGCILLGGAPVSLTLMAYIAQLQAPVYHTYGMTETVSHIALQRLNGSEAQSSLQTIHPSIKIGQDARGCLVIQGPVTHAQEIVTNDLVEIIDERHFRILGRIDNVVNSGGIKIQLEALDQSIQEILATEGIVARCYTVGVADDRLGQKIVLMIEDTPLAQAQQEMLQNFWKSVCPNTMPPKLWCFSPLFKKLTAAK
ncbi:MAG: AMP-binding protein [Leptolyngbyaceae cyanobacterium RM2_2_21]|nr:AMP-binding protein [Leptolyngbyaceae cyanobacterium RM2_2_21]